MDEHLLKLHTRHEAQLKAMHEAIEEQAKYGSAEEPK